jgi:F0F1-type ATP synthase membrane subunit b/b'
VSFTAITVCVASRRVFIVVVVVVYYFVMDSVRKLLDTRSLPFFFVWM